MLSIKNLHALCDGKPILKGLDFEVQPGQIHAVMGPNGAGKSTFAKILAGHPDYEIVEGEISFCGHNLLDLEAEERAQKGLFMSFQYPPEIPGVTTKRFLFHAYNAHQKANQQPPLSESDFENILSHHMLSLEMREELKERAVNEGFSGGEKKRNEILQMLLLNPKLAILDETDSGLDIDAMRIVSKGINSFMNPNKALILITHYHRLLEYVVPDFIHVFIDGKIALTGDKNLALTLEKKGYAELLG
jgi:Fe-S cluster assembly ATP-binding protein